MDRAAYSPYVLISIFVHGLAAVGTVLTLNTFSFFGQRVISDQLPVRVRLLASLPMLDSKPMKSHPEARPSRGSDTSPPPVVKFSPPPQKTSPLSMTRPLPPTLQVSDNTISRLGSGGRVLQKNLERHQIPAVRIVVEKNGVAKNGKNPARRSTPRTELQTGKPRPPRPILKEPEVSKPAALASSEDLKPLQGTRIALPRANQSKMLLASFRASPAVRRAPRPSNRRVPDTLARKTPSEKLKKESFSKLGSAKKMRTAKIDPNRLSGTFQSAPPSPPLTDDKPRPSSKSDDRLASVKVDDYVRVPPKISSRLKKPKTATELLTSLKAPITNRPSATKTEKLKAKKRTRLAPLMTQDLRYRGYRYAIWKKIDKRLFYPQAAANGKVSGRVVVRFEVTRDGQLATLKLLQGSGFELLDEEALMAVRKAAPFPKFPPTIAGNRIAIRSEILYEP